jgi:4-hydroxy-tetrahydrodipicolinate reductase
MNTIGVIGMGRMGQSIAALLRQREDLRFEAFSRLQASDYSRLKTCDVVIEFTIPEAAPTVIKQCLDQDVPVVSGTTGWHEYHLSEIRSLAHQRKATFLYATNFSIGMNLVFALNAKLANALKPYSAFLPSLKEIHHIQKKDSPSGTAYTLLNQIMQQRNEFTSFALNRPPEANEIPVEAIREGEVKGYHEVTWQTPDERITISHEAFDRSIFASGAIVAAHWLVKQPPGIYTMQDIIRL